MEFLILYNLYHNSACRPSVRPTVTLELGSMLRMGYSEQRIVQRG